jgi:hypothetical protein
VFSYIGFSFHRGSVAARDQASLFPYLYQTGYIDDAVRLWKMIVVFSALMTAYDGSLAEWECDVFYLYLFIRIVSWDCVFCYPKLYVVCAVVTVLT